MQTHPITQVVAPPVELTCLLCGITFEPLPWFNADFDKPLCDECADEE
jgi:hypothetical protein